MLRWLIRRVAAAALVVFVVTSLVFVLTRMFTDPAAVSLPLEVSEELREARREQLGLKRPLIEQYGEFAFGLVTGDLGESFWQKRPAAEIVRERLPNTLKLVAGSVAVTVILAVPLGMLAAWRERKSPDHAVLGFSMVAISAPPIWIGYMLMIVFVVQFGWGRTFGDWGWPAFILPSVAVGLASAGRLAQMIRRAIVEELRQPYSITAQSRGFTRSYTIVHHVFRNVSSNFVTFTGWEMTRMFTGYTVVVEVVFSWPGVGDMAFEAIEKKDLILVQAGVVVIAGLVVFTNLAIDIIRRFVDPRVELL